VPSPINDPTDIIALFMAPLFVGETFWASAWIHYRVVNREKPITNPQRRMMRYWTAFVTGAGLPLIIPAAFHKPNQLGILLVAGWALILWALYRRRLENVNERPG